MAKSKQKRREIAKKQRAQRAARKNTGFERPYFKNTLEAQFNDKISTLKIKLERMTNRDSTVSIEDLDFFRTKPTEENYKTFMAQDLMEAFKVSLRQFAVEDEKLNKKFRDHTSKYFVSDENYNNFFQNIINSGPAIQAGFESMLLDKENLFPKEMPAKYIWWVRDHENIDFIDEELKGLEKEFPDKEEWHRQHIERQLEGFEAIPAEQIAKLTSRLKKLIQPGTKVVENDFEAFANTHSFEQFQKAIRDADDPHEKLAQIEDRFFYDRTNEQAKSVIADIVKSESDHENLFENILASGFQVSFENMLADPERCWLPEKASFYYARWVAKKMHSDPNFDFKSEKLRQFAHALADQVREKVAEIESLPPIAEQIEVKGRLLANGTASDEILPKEDTEGDDDQENKREPIAHIPWLVEAIQNHFEIMGRIRIYHPRRSEGVTDDNDFAYRVIEFDAKNADGTYTKHQIAANNWKGFGTFVIKDPIAIDPNAPRLFEIGDLLVDGRAWPLRCHSKDQYTQSAIELCKTDIADLTPYIPNMGWRDKKQALMDSVYEYIKATGNHPKSSNNNPIAFGPLRGRTTWRRGYLALLKGSIKGLEDMKSFNGLTNYMRENGYPDILDHLNKPTLSAKSLFNDAAEIIEQTGMVPQEILLDDEITLAGVRGSEITKYFERSAAYGITHMEDVIDLHHHRWPNSFDDFLIASGLAKRDPSGDLVPAQNPQPV